MSSRNETITCSNIAKKLGIMHSCNKNHFLNKKNKCRHKLRPYYLSNQSDAKYLHKALSLNAGIGCSSRTPITTQIGQVFSDNAQCFEICDNLRHLITQN